MTQTYLLTFIPLSAGEGLRLEDGQTVQLEDGTTAYIHTPKGTSIPVFTALCSN